MPMFFYSGASWRETLHMWAYVGSTWTPITRCWIWDDINTTWRLVHDNVILTGMSVTNTSPICDSSAGIFTMDWTYTGDDTGYTVYVEFNFDGGATYNTLTTATPSDLSYTGDLSGEGGFSDLDSTWFRIRLESATQVANGSPMFASPSYPC